MVVLVWLICFVGLVVLVLLVLFSLVWIGSVRLVWFGLVGCFGWLVGWLVGLVWFG